MKWMLTWVAGGLSTAFVTLADGIAPYYAEVPAGNRFFSLCGNGIGRILIGFVPM